jgi:oligopeptide/dipeptide ABC transporter ATP-binding protein
MDMSTNVPLLEVRDLSVVFHSAYDKVYALQDINFSLNKGGILGIVGETGSGKSVLAQSIFNLTHPGVIESGSIGYKGDDILRMSPARQRKMRGKDISMIFPDPATCFDPLYTVGEQIIETIQTHDKVSKRQAKEKAIHLLELVGIPSPQRRINEYPFQFSGGMIQRAMIAVAISSNPELIVADNPTQALDVTIQAQIIELLVELKERLGTTIVFISHSLGVVSQMVQDVMVLYSGRMVEYGTKEKVLKEAEHPYTRALIESVPKITGPRADKLKTIPGLRGSNSGMGCIFKSRCPVANAQCEQSPAFREITSQHMVACWQAVNGKTQGG